MGCYTVACYHSRFLLVIISWCPKAVTRSRGIFCGTSGYIVRRTRRAVETHRWFYYSLRQSHFALHLALVTVLGFMLRRNPPVVFVQFSQKPKLILSLIPAEVLFLLRSNIRTWQSRRFHERWMVLLRNIALQPAWSSIRACSPPFACVIRRCDLWRYGIWFWMPGQETEDRCRMSILWGDLKLSWQARPSQWEEIVYGENGKTLISFRKPNDL